MPTWSIDNDDGKYLKQLMLKFDPQNPEGGGVDYRGGKNTSYKDIKKLWDSYDQFNKYDQSKQFYPGFRTIVDKIAKEKSLQGARHKGKKCKLYYIYVIVANFTFIFTHFLY